MCCSGIFFKKQRLTVALCQMNMWWQSQVCFYMIVERTDWMNAMQKRGTDLTSLAIKNQELFPTIPTSKRLPYGHNHTIYLFDFWGYITLAFINQAFNCSLKEQKAYCGRHNISGPKIQERLPCFSSHAADLWNFFNKQVIKAGGRWRENTQNERVSNWEKVLSDSLKLHSS